jgi:hypothetical protein
MSDAVHFAAQALITLAGLSALGVIVHMVRTYADKAIDALLMEPRP